MNDFNLDQKLHSIEVTNPDKEVNTAPEVEEGEEGNPDLNLGNLPDLNETPEEAEIEMVGESTEGVEGEVEDIELPDLDAIEDEYPFERDSETGLSLQLTNIKALESQLQDLEEGSSGYEEIKSSIENNRSQKKIEFETSLEEKKTKLREIYTQLYTKGQGSGSFTGNAEQMVIINNYLDKLKSNSNYSAQAIQIEVTINTIKSKIEQLTTQLSDFNTETQSQIAEAIKSKKDNLQTELSKAQQEYNRSEAEAFDKKVLLERQLEGQLTDPNNLFNQDNIEQIFATYGLKEGRDRLQQLQEQSDKAREQAARDEIQDEIVSRIYHHLYSGQSSFKPELVDAISLDMQSQLEVLLEESEKNSEEYREINKAFTLSGADRISYIDNSQNPKLQELVFWYKVNLDGGKTTAEILGDDKNNNLAQYVAKETDRQYKEQEQKIQEEKLNGQVYLHSKLDQERRVEITKRIATEFDRAQQAEVNRIYSDEIYPLEEQKSQLESEAENERRLASEQAQAESQMESFKAELTDPNSNQLKFENGQFELVEEIIPRQEEISQESEKIKQNITIEITNNDKIPADIRQALAQEQEPDRIIVLLANKVQDLSKRKRNTWLKPLGFRMDGEKIDALTNLKLSVDTQVRQYNTLQAEKKSNLERYQATSQIKTELTRIYQSLPKSIQSALNALSNPDVATIMQTIDAELSQIQVSKTEAGTKASEREKQIADLTEQITTLISKLEETKAIKLSS